ncbi:GEVED domain-containing protein, partial [Isoptericola sp. NPDC056134]|uniref:DUF7927 domain-containing protein n=1 Tax=Isoptericola sp. NPDC056134 TaxID=3345723 RepID=UPI0035EAD835
SKIGTGQRGTTFDLDGPFASPVATPASVSGWIDFNGSGTFDQGELATGQTSAQGASVVHLAWTIPDDIKAGDTWARLRVVAGDTPAGPDGMVDSGEVEDYAVTIDPTTADVSVVKSGPATAQVGDDVTWTVVMTNGDGSGTPPTDTPVDGAVMSDTVPSEFTNVHWTCVAATGSSCLDADGSGNVIEATANLAIGGSVTYTITGTLDGQPESNTFTNAAHADLPPGTDIVDPDGENNDSNASGNTPALLITKSVDTTHAMPGEEVTYTVAVANTTDVEYRSARLHDDLSEILDDAVLTGGPTADLGTATVEGTMLSWSGAIPAGATATITYTVTIPKDGRGDHRLTNVVVADVPGTNCADSSQDPACRTDNETGVDTPALTITKTADATNPEPGDAVTYTITAINDTNVNYRDAHLTDDLTDVLDDATFDPATLTATRGTATYDEPVIDWTGTIPAGRRATITYHVTVNNPDTGNQRLTNAVVAADDAPNTNCSAGSTDPACTSDFPTNAQDPSLTITKSADSTR